MKNNRLIVSRVLYTIIPIVLSIVISFVIYKEWVRNINIKLLNIQDVVGTILGIWGTLFGFVITAISILIAFNGSKFTQELRDSGHYQTVMFLYIVTCVIIFGAISCFLPIYIFNIASKRVFAILIFFMIETMIMFGIDILLLFLILRTVTIEG